VRNRRANGEGSTFPYRNGFAAYVWITTPSGKRQRKYVYDRTREVVHGAWVELTRKAARGPVVTKVPTVGQFLRRWLEDTVAPNLAPLTYATYESHVKNYIEPGIGSLRLDRLRVSGVQAWLNRLAAQCQCCAQEKDVRRALRGTARCCALGTCCHQVASPRTIKDARTVLRSALYSAVRQELIDRNIAQLVQIPKQRNRKILPWTSEEARRFLESARADSDLLYAAYVLVLVLELRKGEVLGLAWEAVNFGQGTLVPDHQLQRVRRSLLYRETKTEASDAWLPMPDIAAAALKIRRRHQDGERAASGEIWQQTNDMPSAVYLLRGRIPGDRRLACVADQVKKISGTGMRQAELRTHS
jgi:integrase